MQLPTSKRKKDELGDSGDDNDEPFNLVAGSKPSLLPRFKWQPSVMQARNAARMRVSAPPRRRVGLQYFLDFGQKDFSRTQCHGCGLMYARGEENDEKLHKAFHKSQTQGVRFKGWKSERVVRNVGDKAARVICVFPDDPPKHQYKVREVASVMETEMGLVPGWLLETQCKVYLFISSGKKIVGCLMAEPVEEAFAVVAHRSRGGECSGPPPPRQQEQAALEEENASVHPLEPRSQSCCAEKNVLVFGDWKFRREVIKRSNSKKLCNDREDVGTVILRSKVAVPAVCGVRCLWVSKSERRTGIASHLLDALRATFTMGFVLQPHHLAFSQPTSDGRALAQRYCKTDGFLVYG